MDSQIFTASNFPSELLEGIFLELLLPTVEFNHCRNSLGSVNHHWYQVALRLEFVKVRLRTEKSARAFIQRIQTVRSNDGIRAPTRFLDVEGESITRLYDFLDVLGASPENLKLFGNQVAPVPPPPLKDEAEINSSPIQISKLKHLHCTHIHVSDILALAISGSHTLESLTVIRSCLGTKTFEG